MVTSLSFSLSSRRCFSWSQTSQLEQYGASWSIYEDPGNTQYSTVQLIYSRTDPGRFRSNFGSVLLLSKSPQASWQPSWWRAAGITSLAFWLWGSKKTWSSWAKALRSWARVLWLGEALGGTGKSEGIFIFQTWLRKAKAKSLVRLGLVHLCAVMLRSCLRCGYTSWEIRLWKVGSRNRAIGFSRVLFPLLLQLEPKMLEAFSSALVQLNSQHSRH